MGFRKKKLHRHCLRFSFVSLEERPPLGGSQVASGVLVQFDGLEESLEVAGAESLGTVFQNERHRPVDWNNNNKKHQRKTQTWWLWRWMTSRKRVGRSCIGLEKICSR